MEKRSWYEVRASGNVSSHETHEIALNKIEAMSKGYIDNAFMSEDNRNYWKKASEKAVIFKVEQTEEEL